MSKKLIIKCYKCGEKFEGLKEADMMAAHGLKKEGGSKPRFSCQCKKIKDKGLGKKLF